MKLKKLFLISVLLPLASSCNDIVVQDGHPCSIAGTFEAGANCSRLTSSKTNELTFDETIDLLLAQGERECVPVPEFNICASDQVGTKIKLPPRGGAIIIPSDDFGLILTELDVMCRELGSHCTYNVQQIIKNLSRYETKNKPI